MSNTVDERVVKMQFDNTQFEQNVQTSIGTLDRLKQSLDFGNTSKSLDGINESIKNNNFPLLGSAVDSVSSKFSALEIAAITAIANITNSVVNKLKGALDAVTVRPLLDGFKEYETQLNSVQTIMANTGKSVGEVNGSLDVMNAYADKTIYNFQEMAANLGRFTAAGTDLKTSQQAIMGISNLAAVSGSNSYKASVAMYQLSQAIAAGSLKLQDWNSVVNAGMGGKVFQEALQRTAQHMLDNNVQVKDAAGNMISYSDAIGGTTTSIKDLITESGSFRESLHKGWITTDVLTETLRQFQMNVETTEDYEKAIKSLVDSGYSKEEAKQIADMAKTAMDAATKVKTFSQLIDTTKEALGSGWTKTWTIIFGDFEEAKELWTGVSNVLNKFIDDSSTARNDLLQTWKTLGGRRALIDGITNAFTALASVLKPVREAFSNVFKPLKAFDLFTITKKFRDFTAGLKLTDDASKKVYDAFHGLFSVIKGVGNVFGSLSKLIGPIVEVFKAFFEIFLDIASELGKSLSIFSDTASQSDVLASAIDFVSNALLQFASFVRNAWANLKEFYNTAKTSFDTPGLNSVFDIFKQLGAFIVNVKNSAVNAIESIKASFAGSSILDVLKQLWSSLKSIAGGLLTGLANGIKQVTSAFETKGGENGFSKLINLLTAGGVALAIKKLFELKKALSFKDVLGGITGLFETLSETLEAFQGKVKAEMLFKIATAIGILAVALLILSSIEPEKLNTGLKGMTAAFGELIGALSIISNLKLDVKGIGAAALAMIFMAAAVLILAVAVKSLSKLSLEELAKGLVSVGVIMKMISQFLNGTYFNNKGMVGAAVGMLIFAAAIRVLAGSVKALSQLSIEQLVKGLASVGALLKMLSMFLNGTSFDGKRAISNSIGILIMAAAIRLLGKSVEFFGNLDWGVIGKGLAAIGAVLLEIAAFSNLAGNAKHVFSTGVAVLLIAEAMNVLYSAMASFGSMDWEEIKKGLVAMGGALLEMGIALNLIPKGSFGSAVSLVVTAASLLIVANVLQQFGDMDWDSIKRALTTMGLSLLELVVALNILQGGIVGALALLVVAAALAVLVPILIALSQVDLNNILVGLIGLAGLFVVFSAAAIFLGPFALGLALLAAAMIAVSTAFVVFGVGLIAVAAGLRTLATLITILPAIGESLSTAFKDVGSTLIDSIMGILPKLGALIVAVVMNVAAVLMNVAPIIFTAVLSVINTLLAMLTQEVPAILGIVANLIVGILTMLSVKLPLIVQSVLNVLYSILMIITLNIPIIVSFIANMIVAILNALASALPQIIAAGANLIVAFLNGIAENLPKVIEAAFNLIVTFIDGLASAIEGNTEQLVSAVKHLISAIINAVVSLLAGSVGTLLSSGRQLIGNIANGIAANAPAVFNKVKEILAKAISFVVSHIPEWLAKGKELLGKLAEGIAANAPKVAAKVKEGLGKAGEYIAKEAPKWLKAGKDLVAGLVKGLGQKVKDVPKAAKDLGKKALDAIKNFLGIKSPSKEFEDVGENTGQGLIDGMEAKSGDVEAKSTSWGEKIKGGISDALAGLGEKVSSIFGDTKDTVESESSDLADTGSESMDSYAEGVKSAMDKAKSAAENGVKAAVSAVSSVTGKFKSSGSRLASSLADGIKTGGSKIKSSAKSAAGKGADGAKSKKSEFRSVGKALADGLAKGIKDHSSKIESAAKSAADKAYRAAKNKLGVKSPSRVFARLGKFVDLGLAKGIDDNASYVTTSAESMVNRLAERSKKELSYVADLINSDMVDDPVIKPVMDLSEIQNSSNRLYSMMDDINRFSLKGNIDLAENTSFSVTSDTNRRRSRENDILTTLIDGLKELRDQRNESRGNTYIIDGITYDDGSNVAAAINMLVRAAKVGGRA